MHFSAPAITMYRGIPQGDCLSPFLFGTCFICVYVCQYGKVEQFISPGFLSILRMVMLWFLEVI